MASTSNASASTENNSTLIAQFCSVTGADKEKAIKMLEVCNWNLELAVNMHVDSCPDTDNPYSNAVNGTDSEDVRAPIPQSRGVLVEEDINFQYGLRRTKRKAHAVFDGLRDFRAEAELQVQGSEEVSKKRRTLEDLFRPPLDIMYRGNFDSARDFGQVSNKWLMVNLQNAQEFSCQILNRDVWSNQSVKTLISENFVFWQIYLDSSDGQRYTQFYKAVKFPHIAVLDPRTGEKLVEWNEVTSTSILELIRIFLEGHSAPDGSSIKSAAEIPVYNVIDQSEDEQLKAALAASLQETNENTITIDDDSDLETFNSDSESTNDKDTAINANLNDNSNDVIDVVGLNDNCTVENSSPDKSWKDFLGSEEDPSSDLVLRLPDGKKEQVTWPCTTKLKCLLLYVEKLGYSLETHELITNFPRRNLCQLDACSSLKELNLFPREMIFVQLKS